MPGSLLFYRKITVIWYSLSYVVEFVTKPVHLLRICVKETFSTFIYDIGILVFVEFKVKKNMAFSPLKPEKNFVVIYYDVLSIYKNMYMFQVITMKFLPLER